MSIKIMLDPGHGGHDSGAAANGLVEKDLVLSVAKKTKNILDQEYSGVTVRLTRDTDRFISLNGRPKMARDWGADGFVSIHFNAAGRGASGTETFMHSSSNVSGLRNNLHNEILGELRERGGVNNRGLKSANFAVLRGTYKHMKTALTESLFLTDPGDAKLLNNDLKGTLDAIARGHAQGIAKEFNLKHTNPSKVSASSTGSSKLLQEGDKGDKVKELQMDLMAAGEKLPRYGADGHYGKETEEAVKSFQSRHGLSVDGIVGPKTAGKLKDALTKMDPSEKEMEKAPDPGDNDKWRLKTGTFKTAEDLANGLKRLQEEVGWILYERPEAVKFNPEYRIYTGTFTGKNVAEYHAEKIKEKTGWTVHVIEA